MFEKVGVCKKLTFGKMKLCRIMMKIFTHYSVLVVPSRSLQKADFWKSGTLSKGGGGEAFDETLKNIKHALQPVCLPSSKSLSTERHFDFARPRTTVRPSVARTPGSHRAPTILTTWVVQCAPRWVVQSAPHRVFEKTMLVPKTYRYDA